MSAPIARALGPVAWLLACLALSSPALALDASQSPTPSAKELWQTYPLKPRTQPTRTPAAPAPTAAPAAQGSGSGVMTLLIVLAGICVAGGIAAIAWRAQRGRHAGAPVAAPPRMPALVPAMPLLSVAGGGPRRPTVTPAQESRPPGGTPRGRPSGKRSGAARVAPLPSDPRRGWTAEIEWRPGDGDSRFWVTATADDGSAKTPVAQSAALEWPPSGPAAVQALSDAARALEEALLSAGWSPLPAGDAWYAKRFAWAPRAAPRQPAGGQGAPARTHAGQPRPAAAQPRTPRPAGAQPPTARPAAAAPEPVPPRGRSDRFKRDPQAWPAETRSSWRCELKWDAGYLNSRFQAVVYPPGAEPGRPVAAGEPFKWTFMSDPDPKGERHIAQVRTLASALKAAGWEPVDRGPAWYSQRFVWRREGRPPERVELAADEAAK